MVAREIDTEMLLLHALADDELDAAAALTLERRIAGEPRLAAAYERILAVKEAMSGLEKPAPSDAFAARIAALAPVKTPGSTIYPFARQKRVWVAPDWGTLAASIVVTACLASGLTYVAVSPREDTMIAEAIVGGHRRALLAASAIDIASSDRHTVRPWLAAKLGLSPPAPDLAGLGFPLVGGRVEIVEGRPVPALVYCHKEHLISVVALPQPVGLTESLAPSASVSGSYNVVRWKEPGFTYWAVSDVDAKELAAFASAMRAPPP
jgi:anti-sigma factor RsiW